MRTYRRRWALLLVAGVACRDALPPDVARATPMAAQAPYALWWTVTEACSGLRGDFAAVRWAVGDSAQFAADNYGGTYYAPTHQITLAPQYVLNGPLVRHEMLHALLDIRSGETHPPAYFRGRCAGYILCTGPCAAAPGPPPALVVAGAPILSPAALGLRSRLEVTPASFPVDSNGGWLVLAVSVQNPKPYGVVVQLDPAGASATQSFGLEFGNSGGPVLQESDTMQFGPRETRRYVVDLRTTGYPTGLYVARGTFSTAPADSAIVTIRP